MVIALFIGNIVSATISRNLLAENLAYHMQPLSEREAFMRDSPIPWELTLFYPGVLTQEEIMEMFDTSLDTQTTFVVMGFGMGLVLLSTTFPLVYLMKLEPKNLLL